MKARGTPEAYGKRLLAALVAQVPAAAGLEVRVAAGVVRVLCPERGTLFLLQPAGPKRSLWLRDQGLPKPTGVIGDPEEVAAWLLEREPGRCRPATPPRLPLIPTLVRAVQRAGGTLGGLPAASDASLAGSTPELVPLYGDGHEWLALLDGAPPADPWLVRFGDDEAGRRPRAEGPVRAALRSRAAEESIAADLLAALSDVPEVAPSSSLVRVACGDGLPAWVPADTYDAAEVPATAYGPSDGDELATVARALLARGRPGSALVVLRSVPFVEDGGTTAAFGEVLRALGRR